LGDRVLLCSPGWSRTQASLASAGRWRLTPVILASREDHGSKGQPGQIISQDLIYKITTAKWTGGVAQVVECLVCKYEVLSSNPSPTKKKKKILSSFRFSLLNVEITGMYHYTQLFVVLGVELRLARQVLYHLNDNSDPFCF
jgi:hypothetical protein